MMEEVYLRENTRGRQESTERWFNDTEREKEYVRMKKSPINESFADGSVGAGVRLMVRSVDYAQNDLYKNTTRASHAARQILVNLKVKVTKQRQIIL